MSEQGFSYKQAAKELERLISLWQIHHDADLAEVIDGLSYLALSDTQLQLAKPNTIPFADWRQGAMDASLATRVLYLKTLMDECTLSMAEMRIKLVTAWGVDPRVSAAFLATVEALPWVSTSSRKMWRALFKQLAIIEDPRVIGVMERFDPSAIGARDPSVGEWYAKQLAKLAKPLATPTWPPLPNEERSKLEALRAQIAAKQEELLEAPKDTDANVDCAFSSLGPNTSEEEIMVLADALQEQDDIRGELIILQQLQRSNDDPARAKKIKAILKTHHAQLLGPLAAILVKKNMKYRLGFVQQAECKPAARGATLEAALASPLVRRITHLRARSQVLLRDELVGLTHAKVLEGARHIGDIFRHKTPLQWTSLEIQLYAGDWDWTPLDFDALEQVSSIPSLDTFRLCRWEGQSPEELSRLQNTKVAKAVTVFAVQIPENDAAWVGPYLKGATATKRKTTTLATYFGYDALLAEVGMRRINATAPWTELTVRLENADRRMSEWAMKAIESIDLTIGIHTITLVVEAKGVRKSKEAAEVKDDIREVLTRRFQVEVS